LSSGPDENSPVLVLKEIEKDHSPVSKFRLDDETPRPDSIDFHDIEVCKQILVKGISATKYHYSQSKSLDCLIKLEGGSKLCWTYESSNSKSGSCNLKDI